jgi:hypothetical protein
VTQVNPAGSASVYSTYLGGSGITHGLGIAVSSAGNAYVTGYTFTTNFPTTPGAVQTVCNGGKECALHGDAFVTEFNVAGSTLVYSTYLGGDERLGRCHRTGRRRQCLRHWGNQLTQFSDSESHPAKDCRERECLCDQA